MTVSEVSKYAPGLKTGEALPKANQFKVLFGNGETAISHVKIWFIIPIKAPINKWLFRVPDTHVPRDFHSSFPHIIDQLDLIMKALYN